MQIIISFCLLDWHVFMRFTALVQASGLHDVDSRAPLTFNDIFCRFRLVFFCFRFSREDEEHEGGWCCHNLQNSISPDAGVASLVLWMHSIEAGVNTRFHLLHLTEERRCCAIRGCMKYNHLDPEDADTRFKNITITVFMHSCKVSIANMKCNMFLYVEGRCYVKVFKPTGWTWLILKPGGLGSSLNFLNTLLTLRQIHIWRYTTSANPLCDLLWHLYGGESHQNMTMSQFTLKEKVIFHKENEADF